VGFYFSFRGEQNDLVWSSTVLRLSSDSIASKQSVEAADTVAVLESRFRIKDSGLDCITVFIRGTVFLSVVLNLRLRTKAALRASGTLAFPAACILPPESYRLNPVS
jgi:hypothetical protein